jgi:hypothetical protein
MEHKNRKKKVGLPFLDCYMNLAGTEPAAYCVSGKRSTTELQILRAENIFSAVKKYMYLFAFGFIDISC